MACYISWFPTSIKVTSHGRGKEKEKIWEVLGFQWCHFCKRFEWNKGLLPSILASYSCYLQWLNLCLSGNSMTVIKVNAWKEKRYFSRQKSMIIDCASRLTSMCVSGILDVFFMEFGIGCYCAVCTAEANVSFNYISQHSDISNSREIT